MGVPHDQMAVFRFSGFDFSLISRNVARPSLPRSGARAVLEGAARSGPVLEGVPAGVYGTVSGPSRGVGTFSDAQTLEKGYTYSSSQVGCHPSRTRWVVRDFFILFAAIVL
jgi:hypothetical protein